MNIVPEWFKSLNPFRSETRDLFKRSEEINVFQYPKENNNNNKLLNQLPQPFDPFDVRVSKYSKTIFNWKPQDEVWSFNYDATIIAPLNFVSAFYIVWRWRKVFKMANGKTALWNTYIPALIMPTYFGAFLNHYFVSIPIASKINSCEICQNIKGALIQFGCSTLYPMVIAMGSCFYFADYFNTHPVPSPSTVTNASSRKYLFNIFSRGLKTNKIGFSVIGMSNFLIAYALSHQQHETIYRMYEKLINESKK